MTADDFERLLYSKELQMLEEAHRYLSTGNPEPLQMQEYLSRITDAYSELLKTMKKIIKISDSQARDLKHRENELHLLLNNANQGFLSFRHNLLVNKEYSEECVRIFGRRITNCDVCDLLANGDPDLENTFRAGFTELFDQPDQAVATCLPETITVNNRLIQIEAKHVTIPGDEDEDDLIMVMLTDITEEKLAQEKILYLSYHDHLTGLNNRTYLDCILPQMTEELPFSIIIGDMNGLKLTNDVFGHKPGDQLLINMANVLKICSRENDVLIRWGGDEYLILLPQTDAVQVGMICNRIQKVCREYKWDPIELSAAWGTATQTLPDQDFSQLFCLAERSMYENKTRDAEQVTERFLSGFEKTLALKLDESHEHAANIEELSLKLMVACQAEGDITALKLAARFHDIGKVSVSEQLFNLPQPLNAAEWDAMQRHSEAGFRTAKALNLHHLSGIIIAIHEHWDGTGYPQQLRGEQIPLEARIISIAETYDVLTRGKIYKPAISSAAALEVVAQAAGTQFDPDLAATFIKMIKQDL